MRECKFQAHRTFHPRKPCTVQCPLFQKERKEKGGLDIRRWISSSPTTTRTVSVTSTRSEVATEAVAQATTVTRVQKGRAISREGQDSKRLNLHFYQHLQGY